MITQKLDVLKANIEEAPELLGRQFSFKATTKMLAK